MVCALPGVRAEAVGNQLYISPPDAESKTLSPIQRFAFAGFTANTGFGKTLIKTLSVLLQPFIPVTVKWYKVVCKGDATGLAIWALLSEPAGNQLKLFACGARAFRVTECPFQVVVSLET